MDKRYMFFLVMMSVSLLLEIYTYYGLKSLISIPKWKNIFSLLFLAQVAILLFCTFKIFENSQENPYVRNAATNFYIGFLFSSFIAKMIFSSGVLIQDGGRVLFGVYNFLRSLISGESSNSYIPKRINLLTQFVLLVAIIPFFSMLYGITVGKYQYTVEKVKLVFASLPSEFSGLKIIQISDIHSGSFDDINSVKKGIQLINSLNPDLVLFTGDLVNGDKDEINPYIDLFAQIKAKYGKYAVLGNHDYYGIDRAPDDIKEEYKKDFLSKYDKMGFTLLKNENVPIEVNGQKLYLLGVENWGAGRFFQKFGDLDKTLQNIQQDDFTILMSHDPTHWSEKVLPYQKRKIPLTLSGHTHGMQFGVNFAGLKWSPAQYRYKHWAGLYQENGQYLYVNRGFGFLGWPGRVGMWPEITLIELFKESKEKQT